LFASTAVSLPKPCAVGSAGSKLKPTIEQNEVVTTPGPTERFSDLDRMQINQCESGYPTRRKFEQQISGMRVGMSNPGIV
jgi:hypothetical protein